MPMCRDIVITLVIQRSSKIDLVSIKRVYYYHISSSSNIPLILEKGITANDEGQIFLLDTKESKIVSPVALLQCGFQDYALFEVNSKGLSKKLVSDNVAELSAKHQFILKQNLIEPKYINLVDCYRIGRK